jgi:hypothetical protein
VSLCCGCALSALLHARLAGGGGNGEPTYQKKQVVPPFSLLPLTETGGEFSCPPETQQIDFAQQLEILPTPPTHTLSFLSSLTWNVSRIVIKHVDHHIIIPAARPDWPGRASALLKR